MKHHIKLYKGKIMKYLLILMTFYFFSMVSVFPGEVSSGNALRFKIPITVRGGFYDQENQVVSAKIDLQRGYQKDSFKLIDSKTGKEVPFYWKPIEACKGELIFNIAKIASLEELTYELSFSSGKMTQEEFGNSSLVDSVIGSNAIKNGGFEFYEIKEDQKKKGVIPVGWGFYSREGAIFLEDENANSGKMCLCLSNEIKEDNSLQKVSAFTDYMPVKSDTNYKFYFYYKIEDFKEQKKAPGINVTINFFDENKKIPNHKERMKNKNFGSYRLRTYIKINSVAIDNYKRWIKVERTKKTPEWAKYCRLSINPFVNGKVYFDDFSFMEGTEKFEIEVGGVEQIR